LTRIWLSTKMHNELRVQHTLVTKDWDFNNSFKCRRNSSLIQLAYGLVIKSLVLRALHLLTESNLWGEPMTDTDEPINFGALNLEDLYEQMGDDLYDGLEDEVVAAVNEALRRGRDAYEVLTGGLVPGMDIVGNDFRDGILFVPEVLMAAKAMKAGMAILRPLLAESDAPQQGTLVIGTVKGDIHDIGQNLVSMMMEGAGFEVFNLGINVNADKFLAAIQEHQPDIVGMSALLTTTMPYMKVVVDRLKEEGIRDELIVMVGGAPVTEDFADQLEADGYGEDAAHAVQVARKLMTKRREQNGG
jgi:corrinoid protein of di/trimethylamine methyltransferase